MKTRILPLAVSIAALLAANPSHAATLYWDGGPTQTSDADGGTGTWDSTASNWNTDFILGQNVVWGNTTSDIAIFGGTAGTVTIGSPGVPGGTLNVAGLTFTAHGYIIGNAPRNGTLSFGDVLGVLDASALNTTTDQVTINSNLKGTGGLMIAASGATSSSGFLRLAGDNRGLSGGITVTRGGLTATSNAALGSNVVNLTSGATIMASATPLRLRNDFVISTGSNFRAYTPTTLVLDGVISGSAPDSALTIVDAGILRLNGINTYGGLTNFNAGVILASNLGDTVNGGNLGTNGDLRFAGGTLRYTGADVTTARRIVQAGTGGLDLVNPSTTFTFNGVTTGGASGRFLNKTGRGTLVLGGDSDNSGGRFTIDMGIMVLNKNSATTVHSIGASGNTDIGLRMNGGKVIVSGVGGDQIYFATPVVINSGTLDMNGRSEGFDSLSGLGGFITNTGGAASILTLGQNNNLGGVNNNYNGTIQDGTGSISLVKVGTGTQILSGRNTYTGATTISDGTLQIGTGGRLGSGPVTNNGILAVASNSGASLANNISGTGALTNIGNGILTLSGTSTYSGDTTIIGGGLDLTGSVASPIIVSPGAFLKGSGSTSSSITLDQGSYVVGGTSTVRGNGVIANGVGGVNVVIAGGQLGTNTYDVIKYGFGAAPAAANFSTLGYRPGAVVADDAANQKITLSYTAEAKTWNPAVTVWDMGTSATWTGGDTRFFAGDTVTFGAIAADTTVDVPGFVAPSAVTVSNSANTLTLSGNGTIIGTGGLTKSGNGNLVLATSNAYAGQTRITQGTVLLGHAGALGLTGVGNETIVSNGATLDLNGGLFQDQALAPEIIQIQGTGVGGNGALINSGIVPQANALSYVTLTGNASVGGTANFDIRNAATGSPVLDLGGHALMKVGANTFGVANGTITSGDILVSSGTFQIEGHTATLGTGKIVVSGGATLGLSGTTDALTRTIEAGSTGTVGANITSTGGNAIVASNINLTAQPNIAAAASVQFRASATATVSANLTGDIFGTGSVVKMGAGILVFSGNNTYGGYTLIREGTLRVGSATAIPSSTQLVLYNALSPVFDVNGFNVTVASLQSGSAPDTAALVNLGPGGKLTVTGNIGATGIGNVAGKFHGRFTGAGDIEYNNTANPQGAWDWEHNASIYVGNAIVTSGRLRFAGVNDAPDAAALGNVDNGLIFNGAVVDTLDNNGGRASIQVTNGTSVTLADTRSVTLNSGREGTFYVWGGTSFTVDGAIGGGGNLRKEDTGTLRLTNSANSYGGETKVVNGTLQLGANEVLPDTTLLRIGANAALTPTVDLNGRTETIAGLSSVQASDSVVLTNGVVTSSSAASLKTAGAGNYNFGGAITGNVAIVKSGSGTQTFSSASTYDGGTVVEGGTLLVSNSAGSGLGTGSVEVKAGATLGGSGIIAPSGANGFSIAGAVSPGAGIGTLTLALADTTGKVSLTGASFRFELGVSGAGINAPGLSDTLSITGAAAGDVTFANNVIDFGGSGAMGWYKLFDTDGGLSTWSGLTVNGFNRVTAGLIASNLGSGLVGEFVVGDGTNGAVGDIYLNVVPEPSTALSLLGGLALLAGRRRRKVHKA